MFYSFKTPSPKCPETFPYFTHLSLTIFKPKSHADKLLSFIQQHFFIIFKTQDFLLKSPFFLLVLKYLRD